MEAGARFLGLDMCLVAWPTGSLLGPQSPARLPLNHTALPLPAVHDFEQLT